jgi:predicted TIM-barrel enzyme
MAEQSRFNQVLGSIPILVGVYSKDRSVEQMIEEISFLNRLKTRDGIGVTGVYLENSCRTMAGKSRVEEAAGYNLSAYLDIKVGVNLLPDRAGSDDYAFEVAKRRTLPFIVRDIITGRHKLDDEVGGDCLCALNDPSYRMFRNESPDLVVIGGVAPPYALLLDKNLEEHIVRAGERSDAVMVKVMKKPEGGFESEVPIERINQYRRLSGKPLVLASSVNSGNIVRYAPLVDGFIVGSGARKEGLLDGESILAMVGVVETERKRRAA